MSLFDGHHIHTKGQSPGSLRLPITVQYRPDTGLTVDIISVDWVGSTLETTTSYTNNCLGIDDQHHPNVVTSVGLNDKHHPHFVCMMVT